MADGAFNIAKGFVGYYATLPGSTDSLIAVLLKAAGLEADDTLNNHDTLASLLAAANDEADFTNYARPTLAGVAGTVSDSSNWLDVDADDFAFVDAGGAVNNSIAKAVICYKPSSGAADSAIIPLTYHDQVFTTDGTTQNIAIPAGGFYRAS